MSSSTWEVITPSDTYSAAVQQFFDRLATPPKTDRAALLAAFINSLDSGGVLSSLDFLHIGASADDATSLTNVVSNSFFGTKAGSVGQPTFTPDRGWAGSGTNFIDTLFNPSTVSGNFAQDSACSFCYSLTSALSTGQAIGSGDGSGFIEIYPRYTGDGALWRINQSGHEASAANADGSGLFVANRTASNLTTLYRNNVSLGTDAAASTALHNSSVVWAYGSQVIALAGAGRSLSGPQLTTLFNASTAYVGAL